MELGFGAPTGKHVKTRYREVPATLSNIDTTSTTQLCCSGSCNPIETRLTHSRPPTQTTQGSTAISKLPFPSPRQTQPEAEYYSFTHTTTLPLGKGKHQGGSCGCIGTISPGHWCFSTGPGMNKRAGHAISLGGYRFAWDVQRWSAPPQGNTVGPQFVWKRLS